MVRFRKTYFITDMGIAHLVTRENMWIEIGYAEQLDQEDVLLKFDSMEKAAAYVAKRLAKGSHVQLIAEDDVPWGKPMIEEDNVPMIDWSEIKKIVQAVLDRVRTGSEMNFRNKAKKMGVSYEDFLAAAITQLVSEEVDRQLNQGS